MKKQREAHWVEVRNHDNRRWEKRIAVDLECIPVLCVYTGHEEDYLNWKSYEVTEWTQWREIKEPEYVPYETTEECFNDLKDAWIRYKDTPTSINKIIQFAYDKDVVKIDNWLYDIESLFNNFEKLDGTPCGKLKE